LFSELMPRNNDPIPRVIAHGFVLSEERSTKGGSVESISW